MAPFNTSSCSRFATAASTSTRRSAAITRIPAGAAALPGGFGAGFGAAPAPSASSTMTAGLSPAHFRCTLRCMRRSPGYSPLDDPDLLTLVPAGRIHLLCASDRSVVDALEYGFRSLIDAVRI